jgi:hypothetical protein
MNIHMQGINLPRGKIAGMLDESSLVLVAGMIL